MINVRNELALMHRAVLKSQRITGDEVILETEDGEHVALADWIEDLIDSIE